MEAYRTLRLIDGKSYIELAEHEEIMKKSLDLKEALKELKSATLNMSESYKELGGSLKDLKGELK